MPPSMTASVGSMVDRAELALRFRRFASTTASRAPLYARLAAHAADEQHALSILSAAADEQAQPVLFFAALHHLVLSGRAPELGSHFPTVASATVADPSTLNRDFVRAIHDNADELRALVATRRTQTNEVGRAALFVAAFATLEPSIDSIAHLDIGASAGLNLRLHRYRYRFLADGTEHRIEQRYGSDVDARPGETPCCDVLCETTGVEPPRRTPRIGRAIGLDASPVDLADDEAVRWLEACVWPDQLDRFERLRAALADARQAPPEVRRGDAVDDLAALLDEVGEARELGEGRNGGVHPVVTTSWVLAYLADDRRREFVEMLDARGRQADLTWVIAESPLEAPGLPYDGVAADEVLTALTVVRWRAGKRSSAGVGIAHPHGYWLRACPAPPSARAVPHPC